MHEGPQTLDSACDGPSILFRADEFEIGDYGFGIRICEALFHQV